MYISSVINFIIYNIMLIKFKLVLKDIVCYCNRVGMCCLDMVFRLRVWISSFYLFRLFLSFKSIYF